MPSPGGKTSVFDKSYKAVKSKGDLSASGNEEENPNLLSIGRKKTGKIPSKEYMNKKRTSIKEYMKNPRLLSNTFQAVSGTTPSNIASGFRLNRSRKHSQSPTNSKNHREYHQNRNFTQASNQNADNLSMG